MVGRFFQSLEQCVEGRVGNLVSFVENVDFEAVARRAIASGLAKFADFVDAAIGGSVDFDHVNGISRTDFGAGFANAAGLGDGPIFGAAVQRHRQNTRDSGLADSAVSAEDVAVGGASLLNGILKRAGDVFLADDLGKFLRTVFSGQDSVTHGRKRRLYVIRGEGCGWTRQKLLTAENADRRR